MIISSIFIRLNFLQTYLGSYNYITIELAKFFVILTNILFFNTLKVKIEYIIDNFVQMFTLSLV